MLDVKGGKTDHTAFFCIEVTFFFSTVLKHSANFGLDCKLDLMERWGIYCTCSEVTSPAGVSKTDRISSKHHRGVINSEDGIGATTVFRKLNHRLQPSISFSDCEAKKLWTVVQKALINTLDVFYGILLLLHPTYRVWKHVNAFLVCQHAVSLLNVGLL